MNRFTTSLAVASIIGAFSQMGANDDVDARLSAIKNATQSKRQIMINKLQTDMKQMPMQERVRVMQKVQEQMPDIAQKIRSEVVAQKIKEIKNANPMQRKELMNNFKKELAQMKNEERTEAIAQMRKEMNQKQIRNQHQVKEQDPLPAKAQNGQMNHLQDIDQTEKMNQRQGADQFIQGIINSGSQPGSQGFGPN